MRNRRFREKQRIKKNGTIFCSFENAKESYKYTFCLHNRSIVKTLIELFINLLIAINGFYRLIVLLLFTLNDTHITVMVGILTKMLQ